MSERRVVVSETVTEAKLIINGRERDLPWWAALPIFGLWALGTVGMWLLGWVTVVFLIARWIA